MKKSVISAVAAGALASLVLHTANAAEQYQSASTPDNDTIIANLKSLRLYKRGEAMLGSLVEEYPNSVRIVGKFQDKPGSFIVYYCYDFADGANSRCSDNVELVHLDSDLWVMKHSNGWKGVEKPGK